MNSRLRLGYACVNTQLPTPNRTCRLSNATPERILALARENCARLERILEWNVARNIALFRISSDTIPFGSHGVNYVAWWRELQPELTRLGDFIRRHHLRVSMHPGQFTVWNSTRAEVVQRSLAELEYHARLLEAWQVDASHKIIIHLGGTFENKAASMKRFVQNFARLSTSAQQRLILENDEKSYTLADALTVAEELSVPVVFDVFHHGWNPSHHGAALAYLIQLVMRTWRKADGRPKLHYSNQWPGKPPGAHSQAVDVRAFKKFYALVQDLPVDLMLETKDQERSLLNIYRSIPHLTHAFGAE